MIGSIRKYAQKSGFKILLWISTLSVVGSGFFAMIFNRRTNKENSIASFGSYDISIDEFRRLYLPMANAIAEIKKKYGAQAPAILSMFGVGENPELSVIDQLVNKKVLRSVFDSTHSAISKEYAGIKLRDPRFLQDVLGGMVPPEIFEGGQINADMLSNILRHIGMSETEFEQAVNDAIAQQLAFRLIQGAGYLPQMEVKQEFLAQYSKKKFGIAKFDIESYLKKVKTEKLTDEAIAKFYEENKQAYATQEKRSAKVWEFAPENYGIAATDREISDYYNRNREQFIAKPEELQLKRILIKVKEIDGKPVDELEQKKRSETLEAQIKKDPLLFDKIAKEQSQAPEKEGLFTLKRGDKDPVLELAAFKLAKKGDISELIKTTDGFQIVKLVEKNAASYKPLDTVKDQIRKDVSAAKFKNSFETDTRRILSQASDVAGLFERYVTDKKAKESKLDNVANDNKDSKVQKLFELSDLKDKALSFENNKGYVIEFTGVTKSKIPQLSEIKDAVVKDMYKERAFNSLKADMQTVYDNLGKKTLEEAVKAVAGAHFEVSPLIDPQNNKEVTELEKNNKALPDALNLTTVNSAVKHVSDKGGIIMQLLEIEPIDTKKFEAVKRRLSLEVLQAEVQGMYDSLMKELLLQNKPVINHNVVKQISRGNR